jgi:hypothetical protein
VTAQLGVTSLTAYHTAESKRPVVVVQFGFNLGRNLVHAVVPAWTAGTQIHMDVPGRFLQIWMPAIHAGMTPALL